MIITRKNLVLKMNGFNIEHTFYERENTLSYFDIVKNGFEEVLESQNKKMWAMFAHDASAYYEEFPIMMLVINDITTNYNMRDLLKINETMLKKDVEKNIKIMYEKIKDIIVEIEKNNFEIEISVK